MKKKIPWLIANLSLVFMIASMGCAPDASEVAGDTASTTAAQGHGHDHAHDHDHDHDEHLGPNGGHIIELTPSQYSAEWTHDDQSSLVTVFILDEDHGAAAAVAVESVTIEIEIDGQTTPYTLAAANQSADDPPTASRFELESGPLLASLTVGEGAQARLAFSVGDTSFQGNIEHHEPHEH